MTRRSAEPLLFGGGARFCCDWVFRVRRDQPFCPSITTTGRATELAGEPQTS